MKKYILLMLVVLAAGFTSCSNDDIPVEENVTYKTFETTFVVDPSGVVKPYRFESYSGELTVVPSDAQLRIRLLIYNSNGDLVDVLTNKQSNYQSEWSTKKNLEAGSYTVLAISDVVNRNNPDVEEYWILEDYKKLNTAKLIKEPDFLGYQKEILGMYNVSFSVVDSASEVSIVLKPAGAACYFSIKNVEKYINVHSYWLFTDHKYNYIFWDSSYDMKVNRDIANGETLYEGYNNSVGGFSGIDEIDFEGTKGNVVSAMFYLLPSQNQYFTFVAELKDSNYIEIGSQMSIDDVKEGDQYFFLCELDSDYENYARTCYYDVTGMTYNEWEQKVYQESRGLDDYSQMLSPIKKSDNAVYIKDLIKE